MGQRLLDDLCGQPQDDRIAALSRPLLLLSPDDVVDVGNETRIVDAAESPASYVALNGAHHLLTRPADADRVAALIAA